MSTSTLTRPVFLTGMMAAGKSAVGVVVAAKLGVPFIDADGAIEDEAGRSIANIFAESGEPTFRRLERAWVERQLSDPTPRVVALGGGALVDRALRLRALSSSSLITLAASLEVLAERARREGGRPMLDQASFETSIARLLAERAAGYAECHARVSTDVLGVDEAADEVVRAVAAGELAVAVGESTYQVGIGQGLSGLGAAIARLHPSSLVVVTDENVSPLIERDFRDLQGVGATCVLAPGEEHKTVAAVERVWSAFQAAGLDRRGLVIGVGGGVVTDIAGFAASSWVRGVGWVAVPTTLLAMVDASVGGKTGVDFGPAKNAVGAFHHPKHVLIDVTRTRTEPMRGYVSGLAEVVKSALVGDPVLLEFLERNTPALVARDSTAVSEIVRRSVAVKAAIVSRDEHEQGDRAFLNLGHTLGHALESAAGFGALAHGEAVSLGLVAALRLGVTLGRTPQSLVDRTCSLLSVLGLPTRLERAAIDRALPLLVHDKKREGGHVRYVFVDEVGVPRCEKIEVATLTKALAATADS